MSTKSKINKPKKASRKVRDLAARGEIRGGIKPAPPGPIPIPYPNLG